MILDELKLELSKINNTHQSSLHKIIDETNKIIIIGNGGSNSIAAHIAQDYTKTLKKKALAFTDSSRLTCYINDYGSDNAYKQFIHEFSDNETLVILISSSGNSENIYQCAKYCKKNSLSFILLTGFSEHNRIKRDFSKYALLNYWVNSNDYGVVECMHQTFLHMVC